MNEDGDDQLPSDSLCREKVYGIVLDTHNQLYLLCKKLVFRD